MSKKVEYTEKVNFTVTGTYGRQPKGEDDVYTIQEFFDYVRTGAFIDDDGDGYPVKEGKVSYDVCIRPSKLNRIPPDATHIVWYNK